MELISVQLVRMAAADVEYQGFDDAPYLTFIPVGFYGCEYTVSVSESGQEEMISFEENTIVYDFNSEKYERILDALVSEDLSDYASEDIAPEVLDKKAHDLADRYFDLEQDNFDGLLIDNIGKIIRHVAQNNTRPVFIDFHHRDLYDMDKLASELIHTPPFKADEILMAKFSDAGLYWGFLYKTYNNFLDAYYKSQKRALTKFRGMPSTLIIEQVEESDDILTDEIKRQVIERDNYTCQCCGKQKGKGIVFNADHILPVAMGGRNVLENLQTLCRQCNNAKGVNSVDYRATVSPLCKPKESLNLSIRVGNEEPANVVTRIVNEFYHCGAMCKLSWHQRRTGRCYSAWEIILYIGNNPEWLETHKEELLVYIQQRLGCSHVRSIVIKN